MRENDDDPATMTVAADDGGRISVFDVDDCPMCGEHLSHIPADDGRCAMVICLRPVCGFKALRRGYAVLGR